MLVPVIIVMAKQVFKLSTLSVLGNFLFPCSNFTLTYLLTVNSKYDQFWDGNFGDIVKYKSFWVLSYLYNFQTDREQTEGNTAENF